MLEAPCSGENSAHGPSSVVSGPTKDLGGRRQQRFGVARRDRPAKSTDLINGGHMLIGMSEVTDRSSTRANVRIRRSGGVG